MFTTELDDPFLLSYTFAFLVEGKLSTMETGEKRSASKGMNV